MPNRFDCSKSYWGSVPTVSTVLQFYETMRCERGPGPRRPIDFACVIVRCQEFKHPVTNDTKLCDWHNIQCNWRENENWNPRVDRVDLPKCQHGLLLILQLIPALCSFRLESVWRCSFPANGALSPVTLPSWSYWMDRFRRLDTSIIAFSIVVSESDVNPWLNKQS